MSRRDALLVGGAVIVITLALAWLIERRHILTLREELDAWGRKDGANLDS